MKKSLLSSIFITILLVAGYYFINGPSNDSSQERENVSAHMPSQQESQNLKRRNNLNRSPIQVLNSTEYALKSEDILDDPTTEIVKEYEALTKSSSNEIIEQIKKIEQIQPKILDWKRSHHIKLTKVEQWPPRLILTVAHLTQNSYKDTLNLRPADLNFSIEHWKLLKIFSNTNDLKTLIRQNKLTQEYLSPENLARYYKKVEARKR